jgi:glycosyltransferase involved in cell wall biosynthesis
MMKVAYISYEFPTYTGFGGIATYVDTMSKIMVAHGAEVHVVTINPAQSENAIVTTGNLNVHYLGVKNQRAFRNALPIYLAGWVGNHKFDIIEAAHYGADAIFSIEVVRKLAKKFIVRIHGITILSVIYNQKSKYSHFILYMAALLARQAFLYKISLKLFPSFAKVLSRNYLEKELVSKADLLTVPSYIMNNYIHVYWGISPKKLHKIPNPATFTSIYRNNFSNRKLVVGYVNRCQPLKGFDLFINLVNEVFTKPWDKQFYDFQIYGAIDIEERNILENKFMQCNSASLTIHGHVTSAAVEQAMQAIDVLILPSRFESYSIVLLEAMAKGCIVCVSDNVGAAELIQDGVNGFLFRSGRPGSILRTFKRITRLSEGEKLKISNHATRTIEEQLSENQIYEMYVEIFKG